MVFAACKVTAKEPWEQDVLVVEALAQHPLPAGVVVTPCVLLPSDMNVDSFSVLVRNESLKARSIPKGTVVAYVHKAEIVTELQKEDVSSQKVDPALFNFGDSPIPSAWKERLANKLAERAVVFSLGEWDVGLAKGVEHPIHISDPRPFRERSRRLAPADIDDVRHHLQQLLAAGIIKESRSPYASPLVVARKKNGSIRMCIDYRTLNSRTIPDLGLCDWESLVLCTGSEKRLLANRCARRRQGKDGLHMPAGFLSVRTYASGHHRSPSNISAANGEGCGGYEPAPVPCVPR